MSRRAIHFLLLSLCWCFALHFAESKAWPFVIDYPIALPIFFIGFFLSWAILEVFSIGVEGALHRIEKSLTRIGIKASLLSWLLRVAVIATCYSVAMDWMTKEGQEPIEWGWLFQFALVVGAGVEAILFACEKGLAYVLRSDSFSRSKAFVRYAVMFMPLAFILSLVLTSAVVQAAGMAKEKLGLGRSVAQVNE